MRACVRCVRVCVCRTTTDDDVDDDDDETTQTVQQFVVDKQAFAQRRLAAVVLVNV